jgi:glutaredoxin
LPEHAAEVVLYGRPGCHLCDEARTAIRGFGVEPREVDIETDDALFKAMLERIPVVEVDGRIVSELEFDGEEFSAALHTVSP